MPLLDGRGPAPCSRGAVSPTPIRGAKDLIGWPAGDSVGGGTAGEMKTPAKLVDVRVGLPLDEGFNSPPSPPYSLHAGAGFRPLFPFYLETPAPELAG